MFATLKFTNAFAYLDDGFGVATQSVGTVSGSAIQLGGSAPLRKIRFSLQAGSGSTSAGVVSMYLMTATASGGSFTSLSASLQSMSVSGAGKWFLVMDTRGEWFADNAVSAAWVKAVVVVAGVGVPLALETLGYLSGSMPASNFNSSTLGGFVELDLF